MANAKSFFPEEHPNFIGTYWGQVLRPNPVCIASSVTILLVCPHVMAQHCCPGVCRCQQATCEISQGGLLCEELRLHHIRVSPVCATSQNRFCSELPACHDAGQQPLRSGDRGVCGRLRCRRPDLQRAACACCAWCLSNAVDPPRRRVSTLAQSPRSTDPVISD